MEKNNNVDRKMVLAGTLLSVSVLALAMSLFAFLRGSTIIYITVPVVVNGTHIPPPGITTTTTILPVNLTLMKLTSCVNQDYQYAKLSPDGNIVGNWSMVYVGIFASACSANSGCNPQAICQYGDALCKTITQCSR